MSWTLLPVNYTNAVWSGLKKYNLIENNDDTVSLQDVTVYSSKENSFFGALDANRMNEALNTIMSMLEDGTDLYEAFQNYFTLQKQLFESMADSKQAAFTEYLSDIEDEGDALIVTLKTDYRNEIDTFEGQQEAVFTAWFNAMKNQLSQDAAGNLQNQIDSLAENEFNFYYGMTNKVTTVSKDSNGVTESIVEVDGISTATTTFANVNDVKTITTVLIPTSGNFTYTRTVTIENTDSGKQITESYIKEEE